MKNILITTLIFIFLCTNYALAQSFSYWENDYNVIKNIDYVKFYENYFGLRVSDSSYSHCWESNFCMALDHPDFVSNIGYRDIYKTKSDAYLMDVYRDDKDSTLAHLQIMLYNSNLSQENPIVVKQIVHYTIKRFDKRFAFINNFQASKLDTISYGEVTYFFENSVPLERNTLERNSRVLNFLGKAYSELSIDSLVYFSFQNVRNWFSFFGNEYDFAWSIDGKSKAGYTDRNGVMYSAGFEVGYPHEILRQISQLPYKINFYTNQGFSILFGKHLGHSLNWHCSLYLKQVALDTIQLLSFKIPKVSDASYVVGGMILAELLSQYNLEQINRITREYVSSDETMDLIKLVRNELSPEVSDRRILDVYLKKLLKKYALPENSNFEYLLEME